MTYLGIILDQKLNWSLHIKTKVSKAIKWLAILKPAINYIYGLSPARMLWIYKQILLPRITYGSHVWGHSLTLEQQHTIRTLESLTFRYYAPIWRTTPTASLEVILNKKPAHLEVLGTAIKTFMRIKDQFQNNFWDGMPLDNRASSHLRKLNQITSQLCHEGQPLDTFTSDYRKIPYFNWNPPVRDLLQASCKNDIDDQVKIDDFALVDSLTQNDIDHDLTNVDGNIQMTDGLMPDDGNIRVSGGLALVDVNIQATGNSQTRDFDYLTQNDTDHVLSNVDVNIQMTGNLMPVDGNIRVSGDLTLVDVNTQATGNGLTRDFDYLTQNDTDHVLSIVDVNIQMTGDLMPVDGNIRVSGGLTLVDVNTQTTGDR